MGFSKNQFLDICDERKRLANLASALQDHQRPPADLWRTAIRRGHTGATLRSSTTTR